jgi:hypothetical protein
LGLVLEDPGARAVAGEGGQPYGDLGALFRAAGAADVAEVDGDVRLLAPSRPGTYNFLYVDSCY